MRNKTNNVRKIVVSGCFAAMIFVMTYVLKVPVGIGYVHFGDMLVYLCCCILGGPWAVLAAVIGEGLADLAGGYVLYLPATILIKGLSAAFLIFAARHSERLLNAYTALAAVASGILTIGGYYIADLLIDKAYAIIDISGNAIQAVGSVILFVSVALALDKAKIKSKISF